MPCFFPRLTGQDRSVKGRWGQQEVEASGRALGDPGQETRHLQARPALRDVPSLPSDILVFSGLRASVGLEYKFAGCFTKQHLGHIFFYHPPDQRYTNRVAQHFPVILSRGSLVWGPQEPASEGGRGPRVTHACGLGSAPHLSPPEPRART